MKVSSVKSILWRLIGVVYLFTLSYLTTGSLPKSTALTIIHHAVFLVVFAVQDQVWTKIDWGKEHHLEKDGICHIYTWTPSKTRSLVKGFVYEIILAIPIMLLIAMVVIGNIQNAVSIVLIYTVSKIFLYQVYEQLFDRSYRKYEN
jgi:uncharacterized membrane protein